VTRLPGLDLLRAIAIVWVMLFHSFLVGWIGVDLFFVLSGFLIGGQVLASLAHGGRLSLRDFYLRRAFRILPAFWVVLALYAALPALREAPGMEPWWKFAGFFMNFDIDYTTNQAFSHAWSLCVEEHFYLVFPLLAWWLLRRPSARNFALACVGVVMAGIALRSAIWLHDSAIDPPRNWFVEDIYYPTWCRLDGLLAGIVLATMKTFRPQLWARLGTWTNAIVCAGLVLLGVALWLFRDRTGLPGNVIGWPLLSAGLALLVFAGAQRSGWIGCRRVPGMAWLAAISYSLYLSHKIIFHLVHANLGDGLADGGVLTFAAYATATLLGGALLHYLVERPSLLLRDRVLALRASPELAAAA
jgi:peptidoglycan/LPS O-acetylase OafA/YrhL